MSLRTQLGLLTCGVFLAITLSTVSIIRRPRYPDFTTMKGAHIDTLHVRHLEVRNFKEQPVVMLSALYGDHGEAFIHMVLDGHQNKGKPRQLMIGLNEEDVTRVHTAATNNRTNRAQLVSGMASLHPGLPRPFFSLAAMETKRRNRHTERLKSDSWLFVLFQTRTDGLIDGLQPSCLCECGRVPPQGGSWF